YTPTLSTAVWIGYQNAPGTKAKELTSIKGVGRVTGGTHPARLWQGFMRDALRNVPVTEFNEPAPIVAVADAAKARQRGGFQPGARQLPTGGATGDGYVEDPPEPVAELPT